MSPSKYRVTLRFDNEGDTEKTRKTVEAMVREQSKPYGLTEEEIAEHVESVMAETPGGKGRVFKRTGDGDAAIESELIYAPKIKADMERREALKKKPRGESLKGQDATVAAVRAQDKHLFRVVADATEEAVLVLWKKAGGEEDRIEVFLDRIDHINIAIAALESEREWILSNPAEEK